MNANPQTPTLRQRLKSHEREILLEAIGTHRSRQDQATFLGLPHVTYWRKLTAHGLINGPDASA